MRIFDPAACCALFCLYCNWACIILPCTVFFFFSLFPLISLHFISWAVAARRLFNMVIVGGRGGHVKYLAEPERAMRGH